MIPCRLIVDGPHSGAWNMALDEVLLTEAADKGIASLRFYQWTPATLSLGYFQAADDRRQHQPSREAPLVRRASGGGALVHDQEITYSLALPSSHPLARGGEALYFAVHTLLVELLQERFAPDGGRFTLCEKRMPGEPTEPWLCFLRRARGDVLYVPAESSETGPLPADGRFKVCGSAQRRRGGAVLQHGGLVLERSTVAPEIPGLAELSKKPAKFGAIVPEWIQRMTSELGLDGRDVATADTALAPLADELAREKFERPEWNLRR